MWDKPHFLGWNGLLEGKKEWKHEQTAEDFTSSHLTHFFQSVIWECSGSYLGARSAHACSSVLHISPQHQRTAGSNEAIVQRSATIDEQDREAQQDSSVCGQPSCLLVSNHCARVCALARPEGSAQWSINPSGQTVTGRGGFKLINCIRPPSCHTLTQDAHGQTHTHAVDHKNRSTIRRGTTTGCLKGMQACSRPPPISIFLHLPTQGEMISSGRPVLGWALGQIDSDRGKEEMGAAGGLVNFLEINPSTPTPFLKHTQPPTRSRCLIYHSARGYQCVKHMQWPDCKCSDPISHVTGVRQRLHEEQVWWEDI